MSGDKDVPWNVICPPKNWREPIPIKETDLPLLDLVAERLSLVLTRDEERKKIYLGTALQAGGVTSPSSDASNASGVRYPSGWSAEGRRREIVSLSDGLCIDLVRYLRQARPAWPRPASKPSS